MNHVLDMLEELMVKVEQHEITYIIFSVIALLYIGAILDLICCVHITRHDLRAAVCERRKVLQHLNVSDLMAETVAA